MIEKFRTYKPGRVCEHKKCATILSIYNPGMKCSVHESKMTKQEEHLVMFGIATQSQVELPVRRYLISMSSRSKKYYNECNF